MLRNSDHKNVNKSKNCLTPLKLYSKKRDKKVFSLKEGSGGAIQSIVQEEPHLGCNTQNASENFYATVVIPGKGSGRAIQSIV